MNCCVDPTYEEITAAVVSAHEFTDDVTTTMVRDLYYQYGFCERPEHHVLKLYAEAAESHLNDLAAGIEPCLCCEEIRDVVEGIRSIVGVLCDCSEGSQELIVDKSNFSQWVTDNPSCVPHKTWEAAIYSECNKRGLKIVAENLDLTCKKIQMHRRASEVLCQIPHNKVVEILKCDVEVKPKPIALECQIQFDLLPQELSCKIGIEKFANLLDCGLSVDLIAECLSCGLGFDIKPEGVTICESDALNIEL